jgi:lipoyl(octanoyl) transferase
LPIACSHIFLISVQIPIREYICQLELSLREQLKSFHHLAHYPCEHTGVFLSPDIKIASIGVHVRHRLTTHGIAMNITREPRAWFDQVVACGLDGVRAGSVEGGLGDSIERKVDVAEESRRFAGILARRLHRDLQPLDKSHAVLWKMVQDLEAAADAAGPWPRKPTNIK